MPLTFRALLHLPTATPDGLRKVPVGQFNLTEAYNGGWQGHVRMAISSDAPLTLGNILGRAIDSGVVPGEPAALSLSWVEGEDTEVTRYWPAVIGSVEPRQEAEQNSGYALIHILDPLTYLTDRPIWGAYRGASAAEMFGGALSLAAGTSGKPTLQPVLPRLPTVVIRSRLRPDLDFVPYSIAVGQPLGAWIGEFLGLLAIRVEMLGRTDGSILLTLADGRSTSSPIEMALAAETPANAKAKKVPKRKGGRLNIIAISGRSGRLGRGVVVDNPTQGGFRRVGEPGAVERLFAGEVELDEIANRSIATVHGRFAEMLTVTVASRQPGFRPGRVVELDQSLRRIDTWQIGEVTHYLSRRNYHNETVLLNQRTAWYPQPPPARPPIIVPGVVHAGTEHEVLEPVPRDRLGRIPIFFPFAPTRTGLDALFAQFDTSKDGRITLDDFEDGKPDLKKPDDELKKLFAGDYNDLHPEKDDKDLTKAELKVREERTEKRTAALRYLAWKRAKEHDKLDKDQDGYVTKRDELTNPVTEAILRVRKKLERDPEAKVKEYMKAHVEQYEKWEKEMDEDEFHDKIFYEPAGVTKDSERRDELARRDAEVAAERWPPRLPLTIIHPMAGGLHGFIPSHRQGDAVRVAVHDPFWAEVVGFQYRDDRRINVGATEATAGLVVEHDFQQAWSGMVFRPTEDLEEEEDDKEPKEDEQEEKEKKDGGND